MLYVNRDSYFFALQFDNIKMPAKDIMSDFINLNITEEIDRVPSGSLTLRDNNLKYAAILKNGVRGKITWGYLKSGNYIDFSKFDLFMSGLQQRSLGIMVQNPSGAGSASDQTFSCGFTAVDAFGSLAYRIFEKGKKKDIIAQVFQFMGITNYDIRFAQAEDSVDQCLQAETDFRFLMRKSREWQAYAKIGYDSKGKVIGFFLDGGSISTSKIAKEMCGGSGLTELRYKDGEGSNVLDYNWSNSEGVNGQGDSIRLEYINGEPQMIATTVGTEYVTCWKLNEKAVQDALDEAGKTGGMQSQSELLGQIMKATSFEQVKKYFIPYSQSTAPNGYGYNVTGKTIGEPFMSSLSLVVFKGRFPPMFVSKESNPAQNINFFMKSVTHEMSPAGYYTSFSAVDVFSNNPLGIF